MLTADEEKFVADWAKNRNMKKKVIFQLALGMPLAFTLIIAIMVNFFAGWYWYTRAEMAFKAEPSVFIMIMIAAIAILVFVVVFSVKHKWDINETRYRELLARKAKSE